MTLSYLDPSVTSALPSAAEMAAFDKATIEAGTPSLELMQRAGHAVFDAILEVLFQDTQHLDSVLILCGPGNNGGDGLVVAQKLREKAHRAVVILCASDKYSNDCRIQIQRASWAGVEIYLFGKATSALEGLELKSADELKVKELFASSVLFVDALLGTGQKDVPRGSIAEILNLYQAHASSAVQPPFMLSVDVPTGVNCDTGEAYEIGAKADLTVCIEAVKRGLLQSPARERCGRISVASIGIELNQATAFSLLRRDTVPAAPKRSFDFHKGDAGHVLVLAGSKQMPGAAALCALAALRSGAGLVTIGALSSVSYPLAPEIMRFDLGEGSVFDAAHLKKLEELLSRIDAVVLGPGIGQSEQSVKFVSGAIELFAKLELPVVLDADALNLIAAHKILLGEINAVITPHPGEAARLLGTDTDFVQLDRYKSALELQRKFKALAVLKGSSTVVAAEGSAYVNSSGNPFMATAGSGDVLAGMLAGLIAQLRNDSKRLLDAVILGVFLHGVSGDLAHARCAGPIIASDIIDQIPNSFAYGI